MSTQISKEKLSAIRRTLVKNKFSNQIKELETWLGQAIHTNKMDIVPESIRNAWDSTPEKNRQLYFQIKSSMYISRYATKLLDKIRGKFPEWQYKGNYFSDGMSINCIPYIEGNSSGNEKDLSDMMRDSEFANKLYQFVKLYEEKNILNRNLECLFSSKRFYPNTLKNEFPEAYQIWVNLSYPGVDSTKVTNSCDSVENVRAMLNSNK